jgi:hypothetical protein
MPDRLSRRLFLSRGGAIVAALAWPPSVSATPSRAERSASPVLGADEPVIRIDVAGGLVPVAVAYSTLPAFVLYRDGRVITQGPIPLIYPPPLLPNLRESRLTEVGIQLLLSAAREAGLLAGDQHYQNRLVADAPTTIFTVRADGQVTRVLVYALQFDDDPGWTPEERSAVERLRRFYEQALNLSSWLPAEAIAQADAPYQIERLQVIAEPIDPAAPTPAPDDPAANQSPQDWPLTVPLADLSQATLPGLPATARCAVFSEEEAATLVAAFQHANTLTPWISDGQAFYLSVRPLLPGESGCPPPDPFAEPELATPTG